MMLYLSIQWCRILNIHTQNSSVSQYWATNRISLWFPTVLVISHTLNTEDETWESCRAGWTSIGPWPPPVWLVSWGCEVESVTVGRGGCRVMGKAPMGTSPAAWSSATVMDGHRREWKVAEWKGQLQTQAICIPNQYQEMMYRSCLSNLIYLSDYIP